MTQINLLPWREQARQEKKVEFSIIVGFFAVLALIIAIAIHIYLAALISNQNSRNNFLQTELGTKQGGFQKLKKDKEKNISIEGDLMFLNDLREKSFHSVQLMNELTTLIPTTVVLDKLTKEGSKVTLIGRAKSELQITLLMKNISKSLLFSNPVLTRISETPIKTEAGRVFELQMEEKKGVSTP